MTNFKNHIAEHPFKEKLALQLTGDSNVDFEKRGRFVTGNHEILQLTLVGNRAYLRTEY